MLVKKRYHKKRVIEMRRIEKHYGKTVRVFMNIANPVKKRIIKTNCFVHKYINARAVDVLKDENYEAFEFFNKYIGWLDFGVYWADQDFKSSNHFFYLHREKGMYGFSNALHECEKQYNLAVHCVKEGKKERGMPDRPQATWIRSRTRWPTCRWSWARSGSSAISSRTAPPVITSS